MSGSGSNPGNPYNPVNPPPPRSIHSRSVGSDPKPLSASFKLRKRRGVRNNKTKRRRPKKSNKSR
jgi:hypothetical protein